MGIHGVKDKAGDSESTHSATTSQHDGQDDIVDAGTVLPDQIPTAEKQQGMSTSPSIHEIEVVPRHLRRGLLGRFGIIPETPTPYQYPRSTKWLITILVAMAAAAAPMGSAIIMPALTIVAKDFNSTDTVTNLSVALYMLSMSIFPLWWSSFSETLGRRTIYIVSFILFVVFGILSAVSTNIAMLIVMRLLSGGAAASVQAVGAGTIADIWEPKERGMAMSSYYIGPLCGPLIAPILGGVLTQKRGWRSTQWFLAGYGGFVILCIIFLLPETLIRKDRISDSNSNEVIEKTKVEGQNTTYRENQGRGVEFCSTAPSQPATLTRTTTRQSVKQNTKKWMKLLKRCLIDPLEIILLLRFPAVLITVYYASITFGSLYVLNISIERTFSREPYNFSTLVVGLLYIPNSIGYFIAALFGGRWLDHIMKREARKAGRFDENGTPIYRPEDRMRENAWLGCALFPTALIWYGWTVEKGVHWIVPMIANFFFGIGSMIIFAMATTMLTEFMWRKASTGIAVNNFLRNIFSCIGAFVAAPLIDAIGNGWLFTILGIVALVSGVGVIVSMKRYSSRWRIEMDRKL